MGFRAIEHNNLKAELELRILKGDFGESGQMPTIKKLSEDYHVGTTTAGAVLRSLVADGILSSKQGVGYYVVPFSRPTLAKKHKEKLKKDIVEIVERANLLGIDLEEVIARISELKQ